MQSSVDWSSCHLSSVAAELNATVSFIIIIIVS